MASEHPRGFPAGIDWSRRLRMEAAQVSGSAPRDRTADRVVSGTAPPPCRRTRMPRPKDDPASRPSSHGHAGSEALNATIERVAPAVLELLADGVPRNKAAVVGALAGRHAREDV